VRRITPTLLALLLSVPLFVPLFASGGEPPLPPCCRRDGKHKCAMMPKSSAPIGGVALAPGGGRCPLYPTVQAAPGDGGTVLPPSLVSIAFASTVAPLVRRDAPLLPWRHHAAPFLRGPPSC
jgi:hypothetical protein